MKKLKHVEKALEEFDRRQSKTNIQRIYEKLQIIDPDNEKDQEQASRRIDVLEDMLDIMNEH
jgi:hypothetical protein